MGSSAVNGGLNIVERRLEGAVTAIKVYIDFKERLKDLVGGIAATTDTFLHLVEGVFGSVEQCLIHGPVVVLAELLNFLGGDGLNVLVKLVGANGLDQILDSAFNLVVLAIKFLGLDGDPLLLHLNELIEGESTGVLGQVNKNGLGESLQVVLNTVLHDVVDVNNELLELGESLMHVVQVAIDVHRSPGEGHHTGAKLVLEILKVRNEQGLGVGTDLVDDPVVFAKDELELVVVALELVFLKKHNLGGLRDFNANTRKALGLTDQSKDLRVKVDVQLVVVGMTDDKSSLKTNLSLFDLIDPLGAPESLESNKSESNLVVLL